MYTPVTPPYTGKHTHTQPILAVCIIKDAHSHPREVVEHILYNYCLFCFLGTLDAAWYIMHTEVQKMSFSTILNTDFHQLWGPAVWVTGTEQPLAELEKRGLALPRGGSSPQILLWSQQTATGMVSYLQN